MRETWAPGFLLSDAETRVLVFFSATGPHLPVHHVHDSTRPRRRPFVAARPQTAAPPHYRLRPAAHPVSSDVKPPEAGWTAGVVDLIDGEGGADALEAW